MNPAPATDPVTPSADAAAVPTPRRILVPVDATARSRWPLLRLAQRAGDDGAHVCLLHVIEPAAPWPLRAFRSAPALEAFEQRSAEAILADAQALLRDAGVACSTHLARGPLVAGILAQAEALGCDCIAVPAPRGRVAQWFGRGVLRRLERQRRKLPLCRLAPPRATAACAYL